MPALELEERAARLEGRIDEHSKFFESISVKLALLEDKGDRNRETLEVKSDRNREELERKIEAISREMATNFRRIVGIQLTTWITVLLAILFKG